MNRYFSIIICSLLFLTSWVSVSAKSGETEKNTITTNTGSKSGLNEKEKKETEKEKKESEKEKKESDSSKLSLSGITTPPPLSESGALANESEKKKVEIRLKKDINAYIIESYKAQGNKIIKDLSNKLSKSIPDPDERKIAYEKIQESLKSRLEKIEDTDGSDSKKEILQEFLKHLIQLLDKRIDEMEN